MTETATKTHSGERRLNLDETIERLVEDEMLTREDTGNLRVAGHRSRQDVHPLVVVANQKINSANTPHKPLSLERLTQWLAEKADLPYIKIDPLKIDRQAVAGVVSYAYASRYRILPIEVGPDYVVMATSEPFLQEWRGDLQHILRKEIRVKLANPLDVNRYLMEFYGLSKSIKGAAVSGGQTVSGILNFEQLLELGQAGKLDAEDQHVVNIVDWLLQFAFEQRASDIHLEPRREMSNVRFRIDGVLHQVYQIPTPVMSAVTSRIKILGRMDVAEKRRPQDGRLKTRSPNGQEIEMRLSTMPTAFGEKCVMRIFDPDIVLKDFSELGFSPKEADTWRHMVERPNGIVLVTGPTGSGKTTTLYSTMKTLARPEVNVCTIEDPIEMVWPQFNQMQVQPQIGLNFASGVRTLLRQDPDIIMVGEIRDVETAEMAIQASLTGHLVLSTLHTNDAPSAITRLLDIGVPYYLIQCTVTGIVAQRLVRTLCPHCKQESTIEAAVWKSLIHPWKAAMPGTVYIPKGCLECRDTGYLGRTALFEMLTITPGIKRRITKDTDLEPIRKQALKDGMRPLRISAAYQIKGGVTSVEEALKVAPPVEIED
ncbi:MAG: type II/IV secretion system protein [Gammaproteobacteria bacterium]|nr:MAG: type II/IV secretion system protein [Gammaproteobacteria bacterium]